MFLHNDFKPKNSNNSSKFSDKIHKIENPYVTCNLRNKDEDDLSKDDLVSKAAEKAIIERPKFSIRTKLTLAFLLCFFLAVGAVLISLFNIYKVEDKLYFLEIAGNYTFEIQQARRFEKNFFLYKTNLYDALQHVKNARKIILEIPDNLKSIIGEKQFEIMRVHIKRYEELLKKLQNSGNKNIQNELRKHGSEMVTVAQDLVNKERQDVHKMLNVAKTVPLYFLAFLFLFMIYLIHFLMQQIGEPLSRMLNYTRRIANGDFSSIWPVRPYKDEFSELALAMNRMLKELGHRQEILVQSHKLRAMGTLTAGVAHELNNPLNNITLTACMLLEDYKTSSDEERVDMINDLVNQGERAQNIVKNLLDFAREQESQIKHIDLGQLINETLKLAGNQLKMSGVKVELEIMPNLPLIDGDSQLLSQVFLNLILNAIDAMKENGHLKIKVAYADEEGFLAAKIIDNGIGIPEHILPSIFDPFFSTKSKVKGTGLGLFVSLGIIQKHGGNIKVNSKVGAGTTFTVILPIVIIPAELK